MEGDPVKCLILLDNSFSMRRALTLGKAALRFLESQLTALRCRVHIFGQGVFDVAAADDGEWKAGWAPVLDKWDAKASCKDKMSRADFLTAVCDQELHRLCTVLLVSAQVLVTKTYWLQITTPMM